LKYKHRQTKPVICYFLRIISTIADYTIIGILHALITGANAEETKKSKS